GPRPAPRPVQEATVQPLALTPDQMIAEAFPELPPVDTDLEGDLLRLAEERTAGMSERERENLLVAVRRINQVFELDGTTLRVRDSDGEGPLSVGDRRLDLGNGQFIDLAPGTELEVDIDPQTGLVMRGRAQIDEIKVGDEGDDLHVEVGPLSAQFELRVAPVEGENEPLTAFTLRDFSGEIGRIRTNLNNGIIDVEDASIGAHPDNTFTLSVGGGRELTTRFYLPEIERAQASYQSDLSFARPDWEGARLDIRSSTIRNASILFDGQSLTTLRPLQVENLDAYVSNIRERPVEEQEIVINRARVTGSGTVLLTPGGNIGISGDSDGDPSTPSTLQVEGITGAFDLVTTGPRARIPLLENANIRGSLDEMQFGPLFGTRIGVSNTVFSAVTGAGEVVVGPEGTARETMNISSGRVIAEIDRMLMVVPPEEMAAARVNNETPRSSIYLDASYSIDGNFDKEFPMTEVEGETLEALGITVQGGGGYDGRFMLSGSVLNEDRNFILRNQATLDIDAVAGLRATGIDPIRIGEILEECLRDAIEAPPTIPEPPGREDG
ncbi:MAG: hypothetical protein AAFQ82_18210, partial [Myxococcota bacterium]